MKHRMGNISAAACSGGMTSERSGTAIPPKSPGIPVLEMPVNKTTGIAIAEKSGSVMSIAVAPVRARVADCFCLFARMGHEVNATTEVHDACGGSLSRGRRGDHNTYQRSPA